MDADAAELIPSASLFDAKGHLVWWAMKGWRQKRRYLARWVWEQAVAVHGLVCPPSWTFRYGNTTLVQLTHNVQRRSSGCDWHHLRWGSISVFLKLRIHINITWSTALIQQCVQSAAAVKASSNVTSTFMCRKIFAVLKHHLQRCPTWSCPEFHVAAAWRP